MKTFLFAIRIETGDFIEHDAVLLKLRRVLDLSKDPDLRFSDIRRLPLSEPQLRKLAEKETRSDVSA